MRLGILISGRGSNMMALVAASRDGRLPAEVALVVSNVADAPGLAWAEAERLSTAFVPHGAHASRADHDAAVLAELGRHRVDVVCLAGYMRRLGPEFVRAWPDRLLNVHPSLLPAFPGVGAQAQALRHGVKVSGATVHLVDEELDHGPILLQEAVPVVDDDTVESLSARILEVEHRLYPRATALVCSGRLRIDGRRVRHEGEPA